MKKIVRWSVIVLGVVFIGMQFVRPSRTNPAVDESITIQSAMQIPPEVNAILERSCNDCHSSKTEWPWYSNISPVSWWLVDHVEEARGHLSFSEWGTYKVKKAAHKFEEIYEQVEAGEMPLPSYLPLHSEAKLTEEDKKILIDWAKRERERLLAGQTESSK